MSFVKTIINFLPATPVYAHCDIPCKIYDPYYAQIAAHSVIRMTQLIEELQASSDNAPFDERKKIIHQISRLTSVKEEHAEILKNEVRVIWGDYFKDEQIEKVPNIHELVHNIMLSASKCRQEINLEESKRLLGLVQEFAEVFYKTKDMQIRRIPSGFPTEGEIVSHE